VRVASIGVLSAYGAGLSAIVAGITAGHCPLAVADGIGYPLDPPPVVSRFPQSSFQSGDAGAAHELLQTVADAFAAWDGEDGALCAEDCALIVGSGGFLYASTAELYGRTAGHLPGEPAFKVRGPHWGAALIAERFHLRGPMLTLTSSCSSSASALLIGVEMLQRRRVRHALVIGAEGLSPVTLSGFDSLMVLDAAGCRPFDRDRSGMQIGEAVAVVVLSAVPPARAEPGARLSGGANLCDTHHLTAASPDGSIMRNVMLEALDRAGIAPCDVVAVKAHGTGSIDNDRAEAAAIRQVFGASVPPVLALKRYVGHTLSACGSLETAALIGCLQAGFMPAAAGFEHIDPELAIEPLRASLPARPGSYLLNFFGLGGNYTSLVLEWG
jgi:3-oxoacyl-(acyl-carrier-protein) synthase